MSNPALVGNELLQVQGVSANGFPSATTQQTTTGAIAALASSETSFVSTNITTVGNGTLTAAGLVGRQIVRTGPVANYSDATDTAAAIVAAFPGGLAAGSNIVNIKNGTAFTQTITAGTGVTLPLTVLVPPYSIGVYALAPTSTTAVTFTHIGTWPIANGQILTQPAVTSLSTVGAGTIAAASFTTGITVRSGSQSGTPFTDTTDTAANIIAACANLVNKIGASFIYYYGNSTNAVATLTGGIGVTVSGVTAIPANTIGAYLITYTAAATLTMVGLGVTQSVSTAVTIAGSSSGQTILQPAAAASGTLTLPAATDTLVSRTTGNAFNTNDITQTTVGKGFVQKVGTNGRAGTVSINGTNVVTVSNTSVAISDFVGFSLNTTAGTVGAVPHVGTISPGVYFTVVGTATDTSIYNYSMIGVN